MADFFITIWNGMVTVINFLISLPGKIIIFFKSVGAFFKKLFTPSKKAKSIRKK